MVLLRRRLQAFYNCEEDDLREIVSTIVANRIIGSTLQRQSVWIVPVLQGLYFPLHCATVRWYPHFASSAYCKAGMTTEELVKQ